MFHADCFDVSRPRQSPQALVFNRFKYIFKKFNSLVNSFGGLTRVIQAVQGSRSLAIWQVLSKSFWTPWTYWTYWPPRKQPGILHSNLYKIRRQKTTTNRTNSNTNKQDHSIAGTTQTQQTQLTTTTIQLRSGIHLVGMRLPHNHDHIQTKNYKTNPYTHSHRHSHTHTHKHTKKTHKHTHTHRDRHTGFQSI